MEAVLLSTRSAESDTDITKRIDRLFSTQELPPEEKKEIITYLSSLVSRHDPRTACLVRKIVDCLDSKGTLNSGMAALLQSIQQDLPEKRRAWFAIEWQAAREDSTLAGKNFEKFGKIARLHRGKLGALKSSLYDSDPDIKGKAFSDLITLTCGLRQSDKANLIPALVSIFMEPCLRALRDKENRSQAILPHSAQSAILIKEWALIDPDPVMKVVLRKALSRKKADQNAAVVVCGEVLKDVVKDIPERVGSAVKIDGFRNLKWTDAHRMILLGAGYRSVKTFYELAHKGNSREASKIGLILADLGPKAVEHTLNMAIADDERSLQIAVASACAASLKIASSKNMELHVEQMALVDEMNQVLQSERMLEVLSQAYRFGKADTRSLAAVTLESLDENGEL